MTEAEAGEAITGLYETWYPAALRFAQRISGRWDIAEDSVQEAFLRLYRELRAGKVVQNFKAWTLTVIRVQVRTRMAIFRKEASKRDLSIPIDDLPGASSEPNHRMLDVLSLCSVLSERETEVLSLRLAELKYREIAAELGISSSSVNTLLCRALRKLQRVSNVDLSVVTADRVDEKTIRETLQ